MNKNNNNKNNNNAHEENNTNNMKNIIEMNIEEKNQTLIFF